MHKTLIGKQNYLFLQNDACRELEVHCNNLNLIKNKKLDNYNFHNFFITVFPNKSFVYKHFLPDNYNVRYRPALDIYKNKFNNKMMDAYNFIKDETDVYYKTDTHINFKGNYIVYCNFIDKINDIYDLNLIKRDIQVLCKTCILKELPYGIGDLTWENNLGDQSLNDISDNFYYSDDIVNLYQTHKITNDNVTFFLNYTLQDKTRELFEQNRNVDWDIISNHIIYRKNANIERKYKYIIFYDSFLLSILPLYLELFYEVFMVKSSYDAAIVERIKPDYVFEFRVERFLL